MKQWKRLAALSSAIVMAAATLTYFPNDTLQNIRWEISASADETSAVTWTKTESDGLTWTLTADGTLTISGTGAMKDYNAAENLSPAYMNSDVKKVVIEDGVTSIGELAFYKCSSLTNITIPDSVTCIEYAAFHGCSSLSSITIPNSVTSIGIYAFVVCSSLTSITIPDGVTSIGYGAFSDCSSLKTISLSCKSSLKKSDFGEQADLVSYTNQHLLTKTAAKAATCTESGNKEYWTCEHCGKYFLSDDTNPATATAVELSETVIPALNHKNAIIRNASEPNGTNPGYSGDRYCPDCDTVFEKGYTYWNEDNLTWKLYEDGTLNISGKGAMKNYNYYDNPSPASQKKDSVKKVVIEDGVTSIGNSAFDSCSNLTSITIPDSVSSIGNFVFYGCSSLTSITLSNNITNIGNSAFAGCSSLTSITIPDRVTSIEKYAFYNCSGLTSITIPDSVTSIGESAFRNCTSLTSITIPDGVTSIGNSAFEDCSSLKTISLSCKSSLKKSDFGKQADLVSYTSHTLNKTEAKAATCTENGNKEYWTCEHCKKYFLSDDANPETAKAVEQSECMIPAIQHKNAIIQNASEPTETAPGYSGDRYCPDCDTIVEKGYTYWNEDNLTWKLYADGTLNISGAGAMKDYDYDNNPSPASQKKDSVKKVVIEDGVTSIGNSAFFYCTSLTSITIPNSVTSIEPYAFYNCNSLTSITIPNSVTSIGNFAFSDCSSLTSITIPDSVTSIGNYAFAYCEGLTSITIPDSVTSIGAYAFSYCSSLTSITIPDSVTSIGNGAFDNCSSLTSITISDRVTSIKPYAFSYCSSLTSITIPNRVTSIENFAFSKCSSLTNITIPDSVTSIGSSAFNGCSSLQTISLSCKSSLKKSDFGDQADLVSYTSHTLKKTEAKDATCTEDGNKEYWTCEHCGKYFLSDDTNPETATAVELSETVIPASHKLTKVEAKAATCTEKGNKEYWTCEHCKKYFLSDDTNPETATAVEQSETILPALNHKNAIIQNATEPTETEPGYSGDRYCPDCDTVLEKGYTYWIEDNLTWKLYEDGTLTISGTGAMKDYNADDNLSPAYNNSKVKKVVIEDGVTSIGAYAFYECSSLTSITIPNSVTNIGAAAFDSCGSLTSITIPGSVTSIGTVAFYNCSGLTSVTIPDSVTNIGAAAFDSCGSLTSIVIPNSVTSIESYAFSACSSLTSITIPDSVTSIGNNAFDSCSSLTSITIPDSVTSIGNNAFDSCSSLTSITIPDGVASIESYAFYNCSGLTSITIPDSVTSIGNYTFNGCSSLTSITIPDGVNSIGYDVFKNCTNLKTISLSCKSTLKKSDFGDQADLVSYTSHTLKKTAAKAATYAENGNKEYWTCEHCKKYFLSDDTNPETAKAVELSETVIPALVQVATTTTPIKCVYGQDMNKIDLRDYVKNTDVVGEVSVKIATGSALPDGMKLDGSKLSGKPAKAYEDGREVTFTFTAENGSTANLTLLFLVAKADPTVEVTVSGDLHTEGDLVSELKLILSENSTKGVVKLVSEIKALVAGKNTLTWKFTPEDENNYNMVTGTVVVNAQTTTTTTTTTKATTTTTKATTTTKPSKTTTIKATTTTKPNKTTTTNATTTTKPSKTTTTNATTTTKPSKTTTTKVTTTTKPSKTTTTKVTTTTKPSKTTTTKVTTTTKPSKTTTTKVTTTNKPSKTTTTKVTTTNKPSKTTTTNVTTTHTATPFYGDVNLDGKVDILDAVYLNKYLATLIQFSDAQVANADCCQDGVLNDQDTTALMQFIILLIDDLPVQPTEK
ncbi:MAG: leucine-rich repeat protein [Ruminococcus sp.]